MSDSLQPGDRVTWLYESRGGYGYVIPVPATIVRMGGKRVTIAALRKDGTTVLRHVTPDKLRKENG